MIVRATVRLEPLREWRGLWASFPDFAGPSPSCRRSATSPPPRAWFRGRRRDLGGPSRDEAIPEGRSSLRAIIDASLIDEVTAVIEGAARPRRSGAGGPQASIRLSMLSYNHPIEWYQKSQAYEVFHLEVAGAPLADDIEAVESVFAGGKLHIESTKAFPIGMLAAPYVSEEDVYRGIAALNAIGVGVHNPHQWNVDFNVEQTAETAAVTDPNGLLNPGKLNPDYTGARKERSSHDPSAGRTERPRGRRGPHRDLHRRAAHRRDRAPRPALPLATDAIVAEASATVAVARAAALGLDVWQLPTLSITKSDEHSWAPGTLWLTPDTMMQTIVDIGRSLLTTRARTLVFLNGHGGKRRSAQRRQPRAAAPLRPAHVLHARGARALVRRHRRRTDEHGTGIHAGHGETSMIMHLRPELVDASKFEATVPAHIGDFRHIGFNGKPVTFGWLSNDFGPTGCWAIRPERTPRTARSCSRTACRSSSKRSKRSADSTTPRESRDRGSRCNRARRTNARREGSYRRSRHNAGSSLLHHRRRAGPRGSAATDIGCSCVVSATGGRCARERRAGDGQGVRAYGQVLRLPGARSFVAAGILARFPRATLSLGIILLVSAATGSFASAGLVVAPLVGGMAIAAPLWSSRMDRHGQARVIPVSLACLVLAASGLLALVLTGAPFWTWLVAAFVTGAATPDLTSAVRARWTVLAPPAQRTPALALETIADQMVFISGPPAITAVAAALDPAVAVLGSLGLGVIGGVWLASQRATQPAPTPRGPRRGLVLPPAG